MGGQNPSLSFTHNLARTLPWMLLCGIVGPLFLFFYLAIEPKDQVGWMLWTGLGVTALDIGLAVLVAAGWTRSARRTQRLERTGRRAMAQVLSIEQTGVRINDDPLVELRVRIAGADVNAFEAESKCIVPDVRLPLLYGGPVPVTVDPETLEWEVDWDAALTRSVASPPVVADERPAADRLAELDDLFRRDLLSREEYDEARSRILGEL